MTRYWAVAVGTVALCVTGADVPSASAGQPVVRPELESASIGDSILVTVEGWPDGVVTVSLCGNDALRGSQDCDLPRSQAVAAAGGAPALVRLDITEPVSACPCVIRATHVSSADVVQVPFDVVGARRTQAVASPVAGPAYEVEVELQAAARPSVMERLRGLLGGPVERSLVVTVHNRGDQALEDVVLTAGVVHGGRARESLEPPPDLNVPPRDSRRTTVGVPLDPPVWGNYVVEGSVFSSGQESTFAATTTVVPWGLFGLFGVALASVVLGVAVAVKGRPRHDRTPSDPSLSGVETEGEHSQHEPEARPPRGYLPA